METPLTPEEAQRIKELKEKEKLARKEEHERQEAIKKKMKEDQAGEAANGYGRE
jgi:hypothetical protein